MKAMVLAAGRGARMRHLTRSRPKPLLEVQGRALIAHLVDRLRAAGFRDLVVNLAYRGDQIRAALGDGQDLGVRIVYSPEAPAALGTGGGVRKALPLLGGGAFLLVNADVWTDYPLARLRTRAPGAAHLVLVDNPPHVPDGDYALCGETVSREGSPRLTYSGLAVLHPGLFSAEERSAFPLTDPLDRAARRGEVSGEHYRGVWLDIGTPERLAALRRRYPAAPCNGD